MDIYYILGLILISSTTLIVGGLYGIAHVLDVRRVFMRSVWIVAPFIAMISLLDVTGLFIIPYLLLVFIEEAFKITVVRTASDRFEGYIIASLFGIWELLLAKSITLLSSDQYSSFAWQHVPTSIVMMLIPVFMHLIAAAWYFLLSNRNIVISGLLGIPVHLLVNELSIYYVYSDGIEYQVNIVLVVSVFTILVSGYIGLIILKVRPVIRASMVTL